MLPLFTNATFVLSGYMVSGLLADLVTSPTPEPKHGVANETNITVLEEKKTEPLTVDEVSALNEGGQQWDGYSIAYVDHELEEGRKAIVVEMRIQIDTAEVEVPFTVNEEGLLDTVFPAQIVAHPEGIPQETLDTLLGEFNQGLAQHPDYDSWAGKQQA